ncbi:exo-alpha-sialidase [Paenibacillus hemerocallicola]|uniref:Exo-alpha-sialidase n=1 Tax=Paenibacillus hemerocallicola TaxID=1172614 RepID=A0A5C4T3D4_9BACL|nr:sialidase family protein [Paenibacillus hemerocallicola]TNJ62669.1 exo-alpha-sialidase [Paenibacillus hemerocallicola]
MRRLEPIDHLILYKDTNYNSFFPSAVKRTDGQFVLGFRQAPDRRRTEEKISHIDPSSRAMLLASADGEVWDAEPAVLYDDYLCGVQDPCLNQLRDGTLFATFFMWKVFEQEDVPEKQSGDKPIFGKWIGRRKDAHSIRSTDGGRTWDTPIPIPVDGAIRGNSVELGDWSILTPLYSPETTRVNIARTEDRGRTWTEHAVIESCDGYTFEEPNLYRTPSGKLVAFIRTRNVSVQPTADKPRSPLYTSESTDGGRTWSRPAARPYYSPSPFHALTLDSGHLLLTYGYRSSPFGIRAVVLDAECERWDEAEESVLRNDGLSLDIGYTSAIQLNNGRVLVTYYYYDESDVCRYIAGTMCRLSSLG